MDWKVVAAAPLVIENQLPVKGTYLIWETPRVSLKSQSILKSIHSVHKAYHWFLFPFFMSVMPMCLLFSKAATCLDVCIKSTSASASGMPDGQSQIGFD